MEGGGADPVSDGLFEQALFDHAPAAYLVVACAGGLIRRANVAAVDLLSRPREALLGHPLVTFVDSADRSTMLEHLHACGTDDAARSLEVGLESFGAPRRVLFTSRGGAVAGDASVCLVTAVEATEQRRAQRFATRLAELASAAWLPLDEATGHIARIAVADLADACCLDLVEGGALRARAGLAHRDPAKAALLGEAEERWGLLPNVSYARLQALMTRKLQTIPLISPEYLQLAAADPDHLGALVRLVLRSWVCAPLIDPADDAVLGVLRLATSGMRTFDAGTLALVEEFARVASLSVVRAREQSVRSSESRQRLLRMSNASVALEETSRGLARLGSRDAPAARGVRTLPQVADDLKTIARDLKNG